MSDEYKILESISRTLSLATPHSLAAAKRLVGKSSPLAPVLDALQQCVRAQKSVVSNRSSRPSAQAASISKSFNSKDDVKLALEETMHNFVYNKQLWATAYELATHVNSIDLGFEANGDIGRKRLGERLVRVLLELDPAERRRKTLKLLAPMNPDSNAEWRRAIGGE